MLAHAAMDCAVHPLRGTLPLVKSPTTAARSSSENDIVKRTFSEENVFDGHTWAKNVGQAIFEGHCAGNVFRKCNRTDVVVRAQPAGDQDVRPRFTFGWHRSSADGVRAGGFHFVPGTRGSRPHVAWPPRGMHVEFDHVLACDQVDAGGEGQLNLSVVYELYGGTSGFSKRLWLEHTCGEPLYVFNMTVSVLSIADKTVGFSTDAQVSDAAIDQGAHVIRFQKVASGILRRPWPWPQQFRGWGGLRKFPVG